MQTSCSCCYCNCCLLFICNANFVLYVRQQQLMCSQLQLYVCVCVNALKCFECILMRINKQTTTITTISLCILHKYIHVFATTSCYTHTNIVLHMHTHLNRCKCLYAHTYTHTHTQIHSALCILFTHICMHKVVLH